MFFRRLRTTAIVTVLTLAWPGAAQIESQGLGDVNLWEVGFLADGEPSLPDTFWSASPSQRLLPLMQRARTRNLSPAEHLLMRRMILSAGKVPIGEDVMRLQSERIRLALDLGEAEVGTTMLAQLSGDDDDIAEQITDLQLSLGQNEAACTPPAEGEVRNGPFWAKLRAVCFVLQDEMAGAELAIDLAQSEGVDDDWFFNAVLSAIQDGSQKPLARFDSGLALALSAKLVLAPPEDGAALPRREVAATIAREERFTPGLRVLAAGVAAEAGLLDAAMHRAIYGAALTSDGFRASTPLELALETSANPASNPDAKARTLRAALVSARGHAARYAAVSRLLMADVSAVEPTDSTARMAMDFAAASLAAGAPEEALKWAENAKAEHGFEAAWIEGLVLISGYSASNAASDGTSDETRAENAAEIAARLIDAASDAKRALAAVRMLTLWHALGIPLDMDQRALLADPEQTKTLEDIKPVPPLALRSLRAASEAGAGAELILQTLTLTRGDAYRLHPGDAALLVEAVQGIGQDDAARLLALEATGFWRARL